ncbi:putative nuclease HARBI1 [Notolabrus celidotus]|uniref:putative nuclease HARBI1 n=1 Tax=Notolabrus celidotus TaxID=1203425 RepID=UPI00148FB90E|nr:putative nuclease HARBI1 [Notolabrus celidotus]
MPQHTVTHSFKQLSLLLQHGLIRGSYQHLNHNSAIVCLYLGNAELKRNFRLSRQTVNNLVSCLGYTKDHGWGKDLEVGIYLNWLASATSYRVVSEAFDIPTSTVHDVVHRVAGHIISIINRGVHLPDADELEGIGDGFAHLAGSRAFHRVAGSIDGTHIRIKPPAENKEDYLNRKLFYSIQLQVVCDHKGRFLNIFTGLPGSVHDARVLRWSSIYVEKLYPPRGWCILGDGGYPCLAAPISLLTPYREPVQNPVQARYNRHHSKARYVVERAIGMMKTRWRSIFLKALEVKATFVPAVVSTCAFLHNLSLSNGDLVEPEMEEPAIQAEVDDQPNPEGQVPGDNLRQRLAAEVSVPVVAIPALQDHNY